MAAMTERRCSCGLPMRQALSKTSLDGSEYVGCEHCDTVCTAKRCERCRKAGVKR